MTDLIKRVARATADGLGDNFDHAFVNKAEWNAERGEKGGRYRDINEPMQLDYIDASRAAVAETLDAVAANLSAVQYDPAPYTAMKVRLAAMRKEAMGDE